MGMFGNSGLNRGDSECLRHDRIEIGVLALEQQSVPKVHLDSSSAPIARSEVAFT